MPRMVYALSWLNRDDYQRFRTIMADPETYPIDFDSWEKRAKAQESRRKSEGFAVVRVVVDPDKFIAWCSDKNMALDANARGKFAAEAAMRMQDN